MWRPRAVAVAAVRRRMPMMRRLLAVDAGGAVLQRGRLLVHLLLVRRPLCPRPRLRRLVGAGVAPPLRVLVPLLGRVAPQVPLLGVVGAAGAARPPVFRLPKMPR